MTGRLEMMASGAKTNPGGLCWTPSLAGVSAPNSGRGRRPSGTTAHLRAEWLCVPIRYGLFGLERALGPLWRRCVPVLLPWVSRLSSRVSRQPETGSRGGAPGGGG